MTTDIVELESVIVGITPNKDKDATDSIWVHTIRSIVGKDPNKKDDPTDDSSKDVTVINTRRRRFSFPDYTWTDVRLDIVRLSNHHLALEEIQYSSGEIVLRLYSVFQLSAWNFRASRSTAPWINYSLYAGNVAIPVHDVIRPLMVFSCKEQSWRKEEGTASGHMGPYRFDDITGAGWGTGQWRCVKC